MARAWSMTAEERAWLALKQGEEALILRKHSLVKITKNVPVTAPITLFGDTMNSHAEGVWGTNMTRPNQLEDNVRAVFKAANLVVIPDTKDVFTEANVVAIIETSKLLHYGFDVAYKVNQTDYGSSHSWTIPDGGGPTGTLASTGTAAAAERSGWLSWGVQNPANVEEVNLQIPNNQSFYVTLTPRKTGLVIPNVVDFWLGMKLSGPSNRFVPAPGPVGAKP